MGRSTPEESGATALGALTSVSRATQYSGVGCSDHLET
jgi:hypothetical protein